MTKPEGQQRAVDSGERQGGQGGDGQSARTRLSAEATSPVTLSSIGRETAGSDNTARQAVPQVQIEGGGEPSKPRVRLDSTKSVSDMLRSGVFEQPSPETARHFLSQAQRESQTAQSGTDQTTARTGDTQVAAPAQRTAEITRDGQIKVEFQSQDPSQNTPPDVIVRKDGSIEVLNDFERQGKKNVVIQLEREQGQLEPTAAQQQSVDSLTTYIADRLKAMHPELQQNGVQLQDQQDLVSAEAERAAATRRQAEEMANVPEPTRQAVERMRRFDGGGSGSMSYDEGQRYFPEREVPRQQGETDRAASLKEMVAGTYNADRTRPYETLRRTNDGGYSVGRYGLTYDLIMSWLEDMDIGDPPDPKKLAALMKRLEAQGKVPKGFAQRFENPEFARGFANFVDKMKAGNGLITPDEVRQFMPQDLQEAIGSHLVEKFDRASGGDAGKVALGMHLGKSPDQFTQEDLSNGANQQIMGAARRLQQLAELRQNQQPGDNIEWSAQGGRNGEPMSPLAARLVQAAHSADRQYTRTPGVSGGDCAAAVQVALQKAGMPEFLGTGDAWNMLPDLMRSGKFERVSKENIREGDIILWSPRRGGSVYGHIEIATAVNGNRVQATSDFTRNVNWNTNYWGSHVILRHKNA